MREGKADSMSVQPWLCCWRQNGQKAITRNTKLHDKAAKSAICRVAMSFVCFSPLPPGCIAFSSLRAAAGGLPALPARKGRQILKAEGEG